MGLIGVARIMPVVYSFARCTFFFWFGVWGGFVRQFAKVYVLEDVELLHACLH
jgi:hypothetical protein